MSGENETTTAADKDMMKRTGEVIYKMGELLVTLVDNATKDPTGQSAGLIADPKSDTQFAVMVIKQAGKLSKKQMALLTQKAKSMKVGEVGVKMKDIDAREEN